MNKSILDATAPELHKPTWFINYFILTMVLLEKYTIKGLEPQIYDFFRDFFKHIDINRKKVAGADVDALRFYGNNKSGTIGKRNLESRFKYIL
ncbi:MAG: hypothetical protein ACTSPD_16955 [Promethearchaeota archaeon]